MPNVIVTGGAGFIGSNLVDRLVEAGHEAVVVDNLSSGKRDYINARAKFYEADIRDQKKIEEIFAAEKPDFVCHLAAQIDVRQSVEDPIFDNAVNVVGGLNVLRAAKANGVKKIIFSSTGGALYGGAETMPTPEEYPTYPLSPYGINKLAFEKYLNYYYKAFGQKYVSLRFANVYGPRQYKGGEAGVVSIFVDHAVNGKTSFIYGDGRQTRDFIYVGDVADAFLKAMETDFIGEINISTGLENDLLEVVAAIERAAGRKMSCEFREARPGEERRSCLSYEKAKKILGWQPAVSLEEGIRRTIEWAKAVNK